MKIKELIDELNECLEKYGENCEVIGKYQNIEDISEGNFIIDEGDEPYIILEDCYKYNKFYE